MTASQLAPLWFFSQAGTYVLRNGGLWEAVFSSVSAGGWSPPSEADTAWLESPLSHYRPGSFFTTKDAESFADALSAHRSRLERLDSGAAGILVAHLEMLLRRGALFISETPPGKTLGTDTKEVVYVYLCPQCGFMQHGKWVCDIVESEPGALEKSVKAMLAHKYCPLCDCKNLLSEAFILPQLDPDRLTDLSLSILLQ